MSEINEQLERLIVRSLDGDLSEDEELALSREILRNPQARRLMAEYQGVDDLSAAALKSIVDDPTPIYVGISRAREVRTTQSSGRKKTWYWLVPGAIAAALLALIVPVPSQLGVDRSPVVSFPPASVFNDRPTIPFHGDQRDLMRPVHSTPAIHRDTGREIIGVQGDDGNLYWIEVERSRTVKLPPGSNSRAAWNSL